MLTTPPDARRHEGSGRCSVDIAPLPQAGWSGHARPRTGRRWETKPGQLAPGASRLRLGCTSLSDRPRHRLPSRERALQAEQVIGDDQGSQGQLAQRTDRVHPSRAGVDLAGGWCASASASAAVPLPVSTFPSIVTSWASSAGPTDVFESNRGSVSLVVCIGYASFSALGSPQKGRARTAGSVLRRAIYGPRASHCMVRHRAAVSPLGDCHERLPGRRRKAATSPSASRSACTSPTNALSQICVDDRGGRRWKDWHHVECVPQSVPRSGSNRAGVP